MSHPTHINPSSAVPPYQTLFSIATIVPSGSSLAYISTQWAGDADGNVLHAGDYHGQSKVVWANVAKILKEMGCGLKDVVHRKITFVDFDDEIGKQVVTALMEVMPEEKEHWFSSALTFARTPGFHKPGVVYSVSLCIPFRVLAVFWCWKRG
jgi:enamine deaminase RidA (YjgF/YER057c/UK114 family)